jgi:hypothetical protein
VKQNIHPTYVDNTDTSKRPLGTLLDKLVKGGDYIVVFSNRPIRKMTVLDDTARRDEATQIYLADMDNYEDDIYEDEELEDDDEMYVVDVLDSYEDDIYDDEMFYRDEATQIYLADMDNYLDDKPEDPVV